MCFVMPGPRGPMSKARRGIILDAIYNGGFTSRNEV